MRYKEEGEGNENSRRRGEENRRGRGVPSVKSSVKVVRGNFYPHRERWVSSWYLSL